WNGSDISTSRRARIVNDGANGHGLFNIWTDKTIRRDLNTANARMSVQNGGIIQNPGGLQATIDIPIDNKGGKIDFEGSSLVCNADYDQTGGSLVLAGG